MLKLVFVVLAVLAVASAQYVYNYPHGYTGYSAAYPSAVSTYNAVKAVPSVYSAAYPSAVNTYSAAYPSAVKAYSAYGYAPSYASAYSPYYGSNYAYIG